MKDFVLLTCQYSLHFGEFQTAKVCKLCSESELKFYLKKTDKIGVDAT